MYGEATSSVFTVLKIFQCIYNCYLPKILYNPCFQQYAVSSTVKACGEEGSGLNRKIKMKPASAKQESNTKTILS